MTEQEKPSFRDKPWTERVKHLGDEAERVYELDRNRRRITFVRHGLLRPPFDGFTMSLLEVWEKHAPDFLEVEGVSRERKLRLVEVQGMGRDQTFKLKDEKHEGLAWWGDVHPVVLFVWNNVVRQYVEVPLVQLSLMVLAAYEAGDVGVFDPDTKPKPYTRLTWEKLTANVSPRRIARA